DFSRPYRAREELAVRAVPVAELDGKAFRTREASEDLFEPLLANGGAIRHVKRPHGSGPGGGGSNARERPLRSAKPTARWTRPNPDTKPRKKPEPGIPGAARIE